MKAVYKAPLKSPFSPYLNGFGYCSLCMKFYYLSEAPRNKKGQPLCPFHRVPLRLKGVKRR